MGRLAGAILLALCLASPAAASLVLSGPSETSGTGLGAVNTVLTLQETPEVDRVASGCVEYNGSADVTGPGVCPSGFDGGDETAQTLTRTLAEVGVASALNLRVVFNYDEPQSGPGVDNITLEDMVLTLYETDGSVCFDSGPFSPETFPDTFSGVGNSGFVFRLDAAQAAEAQPCFADPQNRIGLAARVSSADQGPETFYVADASALQPSSADLSITKSDDPDPVASGSNLNYTLTVNNGGPNTATGVEVVDTLPSSVTFVSATVVGGGGTCSASGRVVTCDLGELAAGESATIEIVVTAGSQGEIDNNALVSGDQPDPAPSNNRASEQTVVTGGSTPPTVDLMLTKTDAPDPVVVGETLTYTLTVRNGGPDTAPGVTVTDSLPSSVTFVSATANDETADGSDSCAQSGGTVSCELGDLAAGETETITIEVTPTASGRIDNFAQATSDGSEANPADNSDDEATTVVSQPPADQIDLVLTKTDSQDPVAVGEDFTYEIEVENQGTTAATGVVVTDNLPANANFISASAACTYSGSGTGGTVTCDLGTLGAGAMQVVSITVDVSSGPTFVTNSAVVSATQPDSSPDDNSDSETTEVQDGSPASGAADLSLVKDDGTDPAPVGALFEYLLTVSNSGPDAATGVVLTDNLPSQVSYVSDDSMCSHDGAAVGGVVSCSLGSLAVGASVTVRIVVEAETTGFADDFASVAGEQSDPQGGNNTATERTTIGSPPGTAPSADLRLVKSDGSPGQVVVGDLIFYELTVTNQGPDEATGVMVSDTLPASVSCQSAGSTQGTCSCPPTATGGTVDCDLGTLAAGGMAVVTITVETTAPGTLLNSAVVAGDQPDPDGSDNSDTSETPVVAEAVGIPTLAEGALALLALLLLGCGLWILRR